MMGKKKIVLLITSICLMIGIAICLYIFIFSKPRVKCSKVRVIGLQSVKYNASEDEVEYVISGLMEDARQKSYGSIQLFMEADLTSYDEKDYGIIRFDIEVENRSIYDMCCEYLLVDKCNTESGILVVTAPHMEVYQFKKMSEQTESSALAIYVYTKGKSQKEIEDMIHNMVLQVPYSNKINETGSVKISLKDVPIEFVLE